MNSPPDENSQPGAVGGSAGRHVSDDRQPIPESGEAGQTYSTDSSLEDAASRDGSVDSYHNIQIDGFPTRLVNALKFDDPDRYDGPQSPGRHTIMVVKPIGVAEKAITDALSRRGLRDRTIMKVEMFKIDERQFVYRVPSDLRCQLEALKEKPELDVYEYNSSMIKEYRILEILMQTPANYSLHQENQQTAVNTYCSMLKDHFPNMFDNSLSSERCTLTRNESAVTLSIHLRKSGRRGSVLPSDVAIREARELKSSFYDQVVTQDNFNYAPADDMMTGGDMVTVPKDDVSESQLIGMNPYIHPFMKRSNRCVKDWTSIRYNQKKLDRWVERLSEEYRMETEISAIDKKYIYKKTSTVLSEDHDERVTIERMKLKMCTAGGACPHCTADQGNDVVFDPNYDDEEDEDDGDADQDGNRNEDHQSDSGMSASGEPSSDSSYSENNIANTGPRALDENREMQSHLELVPAESSDEGLQKGLPVIDSYLQNYPPPASDSYQLVTPPTVGIFFSTESRQGAVEEVHQFVKVLKARSIIPNLRRDQKKEELLNAITDMTREVSCLIIVIMSHGVDGFVSCRNGYLPISDVLKRMNSVRMQSKPKVLIVQACQGYSPPELPSHKNLDLPGSDMLLLKATIAGKRAARNVMIPTLANAMKVMCKEDDMADVFRRVAEEMRNTEPGQVPVWMSTLHLKLCIAKISFSFSDAAEYFKTMILKGTPSKYIMGNKKSSNDVDTEGRRRCRREVVEFMDTLDEQMQRDVVLTKINERFSDPIILSVESKNYKLFLVLINRLGWEGFQNIMEEHGLLSKAIQSGSDKFLEAILTAFSKMPVSLSDHIAMLPEDARHTLNNGSWDKNVIKLMYEHSLNFFIPQGQKKAKMHALVAYDRKNSKTSAIKCALKTAGFRVKSLSKKDWTTGKLQSGLHRQVIKIKDECSILVLCLMVSDSSSCVKSFADVLQTAANMPPRYIPKVILLQHSNKIYQAVDKGMESAADKPTSTIKTPNTMMVVEPAEATFLSTTRNQYFSHLADQIQQADGATSFTTMTTKACEAMLAADGRLRVRQPQIESCLTRNLVLPKASQKPTTLTVHGDGLLHNAIIEFIWFYVGNKQHKAKERRERIIRSYRRQECS